MRAGVSLRCFASALLCFALLSFADEKLHVPDEILPDYFLKILEEEVLVAFQCNRIARFHLRPDVSPLSSAAKIRSGVGKLLTKSELSESIW